MSYKTHKKSTAGENGILKAVRNISQRSQHFDPQQTPSLRIENNSTLTCVLT